ncbi:MAG: nucleotidyl transferase AbiEii/AbiGii toxin family protein [Planctomycetes bacterium]|nr:nucleotidyl transferase AbiEii/AbiGii toxin family protein [Planctomycetota bacterium]
MDRANRIRSIVDLIEASGHHCALVGGVAVSIRARERFTKDIDFAVSVESDSEAEALALSLQRAGYRLEQVFENRAKGLLATLRFGMPGNRGREPELDLIFASSGIEAEVVASAELLEVLPRLETPVARLHHLIATKVLAESDVREHDRADLQALLAVATERDLQLARQALRLIEKRGFARGKNLEETLDAFVSRRR